MQNFLDLLSDISTTGVYKNDRTGVGSHSVYGRMLRWNLSVGFPIITTRKVSLRLAFEETMFFLRGETNTKLLEQKNINIWQGNTTREFLDARGLDYLPEGDMGRGYGAQWRAWESCQRSPYNAQGTAVYEKKITDQVADLLQGLKADPYSRRHIVTAWNPGMLDQMALPPCHLMHMYSVEGEFSAEQGRLNNCFIMRSTDVYHGLPYNIMGYALLNHIFAQYLGLTPGDLVYMGWDAHIYTTQQQVVTQQLQRTPKPLPQLKIHRQLNTFDDILNLQWEDIELTGYDAWPALQRVDMAV